MLPERHDLKSSFLVPLLEIIPLGASVFLLFNCPVDAPFILAMNLFAHALQGHAALDANGDSTPHPPSDEEAADSPSPDQEGEREAQEQSGNKQHERDAHPEERKEDGAAQRKGHGGE